MEKQQRARPTRHLQMFPPAMLGGGGPLTKSDSKTIIAHLDARLDIVEKLIDIIEKKISIIDKKIDALKEIGQ